MNQLLEILLVDLGPIDLGVTDSQIERLEIGTQPPQVIAVTVEESLKHLG